MFENPDFQVDEQSEEFRLLNPLVSKISEKRKKKLKLLQEQEAREQVNIFFLDWEKAVFFFVSNFCFFHPERRKQCKYLLSVALLRSNL